MRQVGNIAADRVGPRESLVTIALRTPQAAKALNSGAHASYRIVFVLVSVAITVMAFNETFGTTVHGYIRMTIIVAVVHWLIHMGYQFWSSRHRILGDEVTVRIGTLFLSIQAPGRGDVTLSTRDEIRFSSRPHWLSREEERDERRVNHPVGYEFRDAWEVWCEAGLDVTLVASVSTEDDARTIVRHLSEEYMFVTRGTADDIFQPQRAEPT